MAPIRKYGVRRPQRVTVRLHQQPRHRPRQPQQWQLALVGAEVLVDRRHVGLLQAEAELDAEEADIHVDDLPERQMRLDRAHRLPWFITTRRVRRCTSR